MKRLLLLLVLLTSLIYSQTSSASGYTPRYRIKLYSAGAKGIADSLNWNSGKIDTSIANVSDSLKAFRILYNTYHNTDGSIKNNTVTKTMIDTSVYNQFWKLNDYVTFDNELNLGNGALYLPERVDTSDSGYLWFNVALNKLCYSTTVGDYYPIDTIANQSYVRSQISNTINVYGNKYRQIFSDYSITSDSSNTIPVVSTREYSTTFTQNPYSVIATFPFYVNTSDDSLIIHCQTKATYINAINNPTRKVYIYVDYVTSPDETWTYETEYTINSTSYSSTDIGIKLSTAGISTGMHNCLILLSGANTTGNKNKLYITNPVVMIKSN